MPQDFGSIVWTEKNYPPMQDLLNEALADVLFNFYFEVKKRNVNDSDGNNPDVDPETFGEYKYIHSPCYERCLN